MTNRIHGLLAIILVAPFAANAQITTLEYQGDVISGTSTYLPNGTTCTQGPDGTCGSVTLPTSPFVGSFTASIVIEGTVSANNLTLVSDSFSFNGANFMGGSGTSFSLALLTGLPFISSGGTGFNSFGGSINLTTSNGTITGAVVDINGGAGGGGRSDNELYDIGPGGDSFIYGYTQGTNGGCENIITDGGESTSNGLGTVTYTGGTINPCSLSGSNTTAGTWIVSTPAPEIDPASAASGLTLLLGSAFVLRSRRSVKLDNAAA